MKLRRKCCLCNFIGKCLDFQFLSNKNYKPEVLSQPLFIKITLWDVKEPTHYSKSIGHGVPGLVVWPSVLPSYACVSWVGEIHFGLIAVATPDQ